MSAMQRRRLPSTGAHEPARVLGALLKFGICLALVVLVAAIGGGKDPQQAPSAMHAFVADFASTAEPATAAAHRKEVFAARRARFVSETRGRDLAGTVPVALSPGHLR